MLMVVKMFSVCGTKARPRRTMRWAGLRVISASPRRTTPRETGTRPAIAFISVDLPAPFGPSSTTISPRPTVIEAPLTIGRPGS